MAAVTRSQRFERNIETASYVAVGTEAYPDIVTFAEGEITKGVLSYVEIRRAAGTIEVLTIVTDTPGAGEILLIDKNSFQYNGTFNASDVFNFEGSQTGYTKKPHALGSIKCGGQGDALNVANGYGGIDGTYYETISVISTVLKYAPRPDAPLKWVTIWNTGAGDVRIQINRKPTAADGDTGFLLTTTDPPAVFEFRIDELSFIKKTAEVDTSVQILGAY